jgi:hydrogenase maturation protein HypF
MARAEIAATGVVQGVGFRPFIYRLANRHGLVGFVRNMGDAGVQIIVEGEKKKITKFIAAILVQKPPLARVDEVRVKWSRATGEFKMFSVVKSEKAGLGLTSVVPPDIALCDDCKREMFDPTDRRYLYPFTTCVNCGPRYTIIEELPYDRPRTSMKAFLLCADCAREYKDPADRRYHAEPTCCSICGPKLKLYDGGGERVDVVDPALETAKLLDDGNVIAIKGIGGIHVAAKTTGNDVVARIRKSFNRPQQPFATMSRDLKTIKKFAKINKLEEKLLTSYRRPIVALQKSSNYILSELVSPGIDSVGVMLPYSGIHHLILHYGKDPAYIMTSANVAGLPMLIENDEAIRNLKGKVDYFLLHDRKIVNRCDDSVVKIVDGAPAFLRRSRGHVPDPTKMAFKSREKILALGAELNDTISILIDNNCFVSQHIGDTTKVETLEYMHETAGRLMNLLGLKKVDVVARDMHPLYATTGLAAKMAMRMKARTVAVQHHHAHLAALMAEHGLDELVGIAGDGVGYGSDGTVWGGEVMVADLKSFERVGGLMKQRMPGGDLATEYPARMVAGMLWQAMEPKEIERVLIEFCSSGFKHGKKEIDVVLHQIERNLNVFWTSSCGRVLDAAACLLSICSVRTYEGEPAMKLEAAAMGGDPKKVKLNVEIKKDGNLNVVDTSQILLGALKALRARVPRRHIAAAVQRALAEGLSEIAITAAFDEKMKVAGCSGGVFYNDAMTTAARKFVTRSRLKFVRHEFLPTGDGGISVGQAVVAAHS